MSDNERVKEIIEQYTAGMRAFGKSIQEALSHATEMNHRFMELAALIGEVQVPSDKTKILVMDDTGNEQSGLITVLLALAAIDENIFWSPDMRGHFYGLGAQAWNPQGSPPGTPASEDIAPVETSHRLMTLAQETFSINRPLPIWKGTEMPFSSAPGGASRDVPRDPEWFNHPLFDNEIVQSMVRFHDEHPDGILACVVGGSLREAAAFCLLMDRTVPYWKQHMSIWFFAKSLQWRDGGWHREHNQRVDTEALRYMVTHHEDILAIVPGQIKPSKSPIHPDGPSYRYYPMAGPNVMFRTTIEEAAAEDSPLGARWKLFLERTRGMHGSYSAASSMMVREHAWVQDFYHLDDAVMTYMVMECDDLGDPFNRDVYSELEVAFPIWYGPKFDESGNLVEGEYDPETTITLMVPNLHKTSDEVKNLLMDD